MDTFDDIVIGSGLAALGTVLGLPSTRRVAILSGAPPGRFAHYDDRGAVPCAFDGPGGLGGYWHGVIPMSQSMVFADTEAEAFATLFPRFYPRADLPQWLGQSALFVPWKPIRPAQALTQLVAEHGARLQWVTGLATRLHTADGGITTVETSQGQRLQAPRVWVAAGAVHTPALLASSYEATLRRPHVSDHVLCYVGQVDGAQAPRTHRTADGVYFPARLGDSLPALYTLRPARFAFRQLDHGIEQRAAFGLPTGGAIAKIMRSLSPGLLAEAFYNRFGLFAGAQRYSIYAQVHAPDAYSLGDGPLPLTPDLAHIRALGDQARRHQPFEGARLSRRNDLYIPGIHLHHSLDMARWRALGVPGVQVVDAAALPSIGAEHHSFRLLCQAWSRARQSA